MFHEQKLSKQGKQSVYDVGIPRRKTKFHSPTSKYSGWALKLFTHPSPARTVATLFALVLIPLHDDLFSDNRNALSEINLKLASYVLTDQQVSEFNSSNWFCRHPKT